jgi:hypothetical protein
MTYREPHDFPWQEGVSGFWWEGDIREPGFVRDVLPPSTWDDRSLAQIGGRMATEAKAPSKGTSTLEVMTHGSREGRCQVHRQCCDRRTRRVPASGFLIRAAHATRATFPTARGESPDRHHRGWPPALPYCADRCLHSVHQTSPHRRR